MELVGGRPFLLPRSTDSGLGRLSRPTSLGAAELIWIAFVLVQALDGAMTFLGVQAFGTAIEANPLVAWYVSAFGPAVALAAAKLFAIACGIALHLTGRHGTLAALTCTYVVAAVGPWMHILWQYW